MKRFVMAAVGLLVLAEVSMAAEAPTPPSPPTTAPAAPASANPVAETPATPAAPGLRAYADPVTGQLRQPTEQERTLDAVTLPRRSDRSATWIETLPDGSKMLHAEGQLMMTTMATVDAAGQVVVECDPKDSHPDAAAEPSK